MAKKYDVGLKVLLKTHLDDWLALVPRQPRGPVRIIDSDVATVTAATDKVLRIDDSTPWILHVEFQSTRDPSLEWRVPWYNALLEYKHRCLVHSMVVLLTKDAETPGLNGEWTRGFAQEPPYRYFRYQVIRVWQLHAEQLMHGPWGTFPLAVLCDDAPEMPELVQQMRNRVVHAQPVSTEAREIWALTALLLGLRYKDPLLSELMKEMRDMIDLTESLSYKKIVAEGKAVGLAEGKAAGRIDALRDTVLRLGKKKLGKPSPKVTRDLNAITDERRLTELSERILDVETWKELLAPES
jgi:predicted transposase YdaD